MNIDHEIKAEQALANSNLVELTTIDHHQDLNAPNPVEHQQIIIAENTNGLTTMTTADGLTVTAILNADHANTAGLGNYKKKFSLALLQI